MRTRDQLLPPLLTGSVIAVTFVLLTGLELFRALRNPRESKVKHVTRNLAMAASAAVVMGVSELPAIIPVARYWAAHDLGILRSVPLPPMARSVLAIVLLDYTLYLWHVLTHKVPFLWRFHLSHHIDLDCDASTALRFHFGELLLSVPFRAVQVMVLGVAVREYSMWQTILFASILFHHSNVELSPRWDRLLSYLVVTPRMHGIHHDFILKHANSNWSSGLTVWDRLHGTLQLGIPQAAIVIGVPAYQHEEDVTLRRSLLLPFTSARDDWNPVRDYSGESSRLPG
jgi:sterol desaturase/sphingolipid hydroxylase (fatty acid hydroxylase superfamily)